MSNIRSFGDFSEDSRDEPYRFVGGHRSGIGIEDSHKVHLYEGGFTVDDGPFRPLEDPKNALFLSSVKSGVAPPELQDEGKEVRVIFIDESHRKYQAPKEPWGDVSRASKQTVTSQVEDISLGHKSGPLTTLRIRLLNGRQINLSISQAATVGELRCFIGEQSGIPTQASRLLTGFPPSDLKGSDTDTLKDAELIGCTIVQRRVN